MSPAPTSKQHQKGITESRKPNTGIATETLVQAVQETVFQRGSQTSDMERIKPGEAR